MPQTTGLAATCHKPPAVRCNRLQPTAECHATANTKPAPRPHLRRGAPARRVAACCAAGPLRSAAAQGGPSRGGADRLRTRRCIVCWGHQNTTAPHRTAAQPHRVSAHGPCSKCSSRLTWKARTRSSRRSSMKSSGISRMAKACGGGQGREGVRGNDEPRVTAVGCVCRTQMGVDTTNQQIYNKPAACAHRAAQLPPRASAGQRCSADTSRLAHPEHHAPDDE